MIMPVLVPRGGWTNMSWPEDPYGSGQTRRAKPRLLTSTSTYSARNNHGQVAPVSYAVVYLRLHRTKTRDITGGLTFGFRALAALTLDETAELVRLADLDLLRARRLAQVLVGYGLLADLNLLLQASTAMRPPEPCGDNEFGRGLRALATEWGHRSRRQRGDTTFFDTGHDLPGDNLDEAGGATDPAELLQRQAKTAGLSFSGSSRAATPQFNVDAVARQHGRQRAAREWLAVCATERALLSALIAARHLGLYEWSGDLDVTTDLENGMGDCFPTQQLHAKAPL